MPYTYPRIEILLGRPIPVQNATFQNIWRLITLYRAAFRPAIVYLRALYLAFLFPIYLFLVLLNSIPVISKTEVVSRISTASGDWNATGDWLYFFLVIFKSVGGGWWLFWPIYFTFEDLPAFHHNYTESWRQKFREEQRNLHTPLPECSLIIFIDNKNMMEIPCLWSMDDRSLLQLIREFYFLRKCEGGIIEALGMKSLELVEVVKLEAHKAIGNPESILELGRDRGNRPLNLFRNLPSGGDDTIKRLLCQKEVLAEPDKHEYALNFVRKFNSDTASFVIATPITISAIFSVVWVIVAVKKYGADVQASIQTGFTVGSYIVTAGALLIALIAFLDTRYDSSRRYVEGRVIGNP